MVHSFDGTIEEANQLINLGLYIGLNACSMKTRLNLDCIVMINTDRIVVESDSPWCDFRPTHASFDHLSHATKSMIQSQVKKERFKEGAMVKGRNEPCMIL